MEAFCCFSSFTAGTPASHLIHEAGADWPGRRRNARRRPWPDQRSHRRSRVVSPKQPAVSRMGLLHASESAAASGARVRGHGCAPVRGRSIAGNRDCKHLRWMLLLRRARVAAPPPDG